MKDLDKALRMMEVIKKHLHEEEQQLEEQTKLQRKKHQQAELEELEIEDLAWKERVNEMIREDDEIEAEVVHKHLEEEEKYWQEKNKFPNWVNETAGTKEASISLHDFDNNNFNHDDFLNSLKQLENIETFSTENGNYQINLQNGKRLQFHPQAKKINFNDFSDETLGLIVDITKAAGCDKLNISELFEQRKSYNLNVRHFQYFQNILTNSGIQLSFTKNVENDNEIQLQNSFTRR